MHLALVIANARNGLLCDRHHTIKVSALLPSFHLLRRVARAVIVQVLHKHVLLHQRGNGFQFSTDSIIASPHRLGKPTAHVGITEFPNIPKHIVCVNETGVGINSMSLLRTRSLPFE